MERENVQIQKIQIQHIFIDFEFNPVAVTPGDLQLFVFCHATMKEMTASTSVTCVFFTPEPTEILKRFGYSI